MVRKGACGGDDGDVREEILSSTKESEKIINQTGRTQQIIT